MQRQPLAQTRLGDGQIGQSHALQWPGHRFARHLPPPTFGRGILKHGIEMIHAHEPELFRLAFHFRGKNPPGAANGAVRHHDRLAAHCVEHLVVIAQELNRIRFRLAAQLDAQHELIRIHGVVFGIGHAQRAGLIKHLISCHIKVEHIGGSG